MRLPARLLHRKTAAHKGDFGHILILAGCAQYSGAALLCSLAAMRTGAGLVTLGIPCGLVTSILKVKPPELMLEPLAQTRQLTLSIAASPRIKELLKSNVDILIIGPGLSKNKSTREVVIRLVRLVDKPIMLDADGINALCGNLNLLKRRRRSAEFIITPHPGEMARLSGKSVKEIQSNRKKIAFEFAKSYRVTVVLKGHHTVVADHRGNLYVNKTGNPGMATAGSGDVLSGMIGALMAQGLACFEAARYAVYLHGLAGDLAMKEKTQVCLIASDIIDKIPQAIKMSSS